jgi:hypothetical protein
LERVKSAGGGKVSLQRVVARARRSNMRYDRVEWDGRGCHRFKLGMGLRGPCLAALSSGVRSRWRCIGEGGEWG